MLKKAIIFDLDGTLWDTTNQTVESFNYVLKKYNYNEVTKEKICGNFGNNKVETINNIFSFLDYKKGEMLLDEVDEHIIENLSKSCNGIYSGVDKTIKEIYEIYDLYIVSNSAHKSYIEAFLKSGNYYKYFKDYIAASEIALSKSDAIKKIIYDNKIDKAIYVGDTEKDMIASQESNIPFIHCLYGFGKELNCEYKINDITDLYNQVKKII